MRQFLHWLQAGQEAAPAVAERPLEPAEIADKWLDRLLKDQGEARTLSMKLVGFNCCNELCTELNKIAAGMEQLYKSLSGKRRAGDTLTADTLQADITPGPCLIDCKRNRFTCRIAYKTATRGQTCCLSGRGRSLWTPSTRTVAWLRACSSLWSRRNARKSQALGSLVFNPFKGQLTKTEHSRLQPERMCWRGSGRMRSPSLMPSQRGRRAAPRDAEFLS